MKLWGAALLTSSVVWANNAHAQVLITEVQANPPSTPDDEEWVEIHNTGTGMVDIGGWGVADFSGANQGRLYTFPAGTMLAPNQVIIVARQATAYVTQFPAAPAPSFEMEPGGTNHPTPDLTRGPSGNNFALGNAGDAVVLLDGAAALVSGVEWATDNATVPGMPAAAAPAMQSLGRVAVTGSSDADFVILTTPTPGVGYSANMPIPPNVSMTTRAPAVFAHGTAVTLGASVSDADGVGSVDFYAAIATSSTGAAAGTYVALPATGAAGVYTISGPVENLAAALMFGAPTGFHERYVRWYVRAADTGGAATVLPAMATTAANNTAFYWENVLGPSSVFSIAEVRAQNANQRPLWEHHSVRIEGVALTTDHAFATTTTNFFIVSMDGNDAIRIFDNDALPTAVNPGDVVRVTGKVGVFNGVRQVGRDERGSSVPQVSGPEIVVLATGTANVPVRTLTITNLLAGAEGYESQLVEIANAMFVTGPGGEVVPPTFASNGSVWVSDGTGSLEVSVRANVDLVGQPTRAGTFAIRGILTQGNASSYRLQPRSSADLIGGTPVDGGTPGDGGAPVDGGDPADGGPRPDATPGLDALPNPVDSGTPGADAGFPGFDAAVGFDATTGGDGGGPARPDSGVFGNNDNREEDSGCGCDTSRGGAPATAAALGLVLAASLLRRRRGR